MDTRCLTHPVRHLVDDLLDLLHHVVVRFPRDAVQLHVRAFRIRFSHRALCPLQQAFSCLVDKYVSTEQLLWSVKQLRTC